MGVGFLAVVGYFVWLDWRKESPHTPRERFPYLAYLAVCVASGLIFLGVGIRNWLIRM